MATTTYRDYSAATWAPWGADDGYLYRWHFVQGLTKDILAEGATQAVNVRFLTLSPPADALDQAARDRGIERGPTETSSTFATRLAASFDAYRYAGTEKAIKDQLGYAGFPGAVVYEDSDWVWDAATGTDWWRFWVVFPEGTFPYVTYPVWGFPSWGGFTWSDVATADQLATMCRIIHKWKPAHADLIKIIIVLSGHLWGDGYVWGSGTWGGSAAYLDC